MINKILENKKDMFDLIEKDLVNYLKEKEKNINIINNHSIFKF